MALFLLENQAPPPPEEYDLNEYQSALIDYPPGRQPTEGERIIDGFALLNANEND